MTWNVPLKATLLFCVAIAASPALAHNPAKNSHSVTWHGLCISPAKNAFYVKPGTPDSEVFTRRYVGKIHGGWLGVFIPFHEVKTAIPGWSPDTPYADLTSGGLAIEIASDDPMPHGELPDHLKDLYSLTGPYKGAKIFKLYGKHDVFTGLYSVEMKSDRLFTHFAMLSINPHAPHNPPLKAWHQWYLGRCKSSGNIPNTTITCYMNFVDQRTVIVFPLKDNDIPLARQVEAFLSHKVHEWRATCHAKP